MISTALVSLAIAVSVPFDQPAPARSTDLPAFLTEQHQSIRRFLAAAAEKMPEADFHFKPQGLGPDVRTFGQIVAHLATSNYALCSGAKGEKMPYIPLDDLKETRPKAELVKALNAALAYCDPVYASQTVASLNEMISRELANKTTIERARGGNLVWNIAHNNEHYGNLVTYMRAKGLVPPSSDGTGR